MAVIKTNPEETQTIEGAEHGATISLILDCSAPGQGPRLHRHPYDETWLVIDGTVNFQAGNETHVAGPGDVVIVPANTAHKFTTDGAGPSRLVCIHASPTVIGERLE
ncbi:MAG: cupin domain-containing protein [Solirubrobacteraceae bacterium]